MLCETYRQFIFHFTQPKTLYNFCLGELKNITLPPNFKKQCLNKILNARKKSKADVNTSSANNDVDSLSEDDIPVASLTGNRPMTRQVTSSSNGKAAKAIENAKNNSIKSGSIGGQETTKSKVPAKSNSTDNVTLKSNARPAKKGTTTQTEKNATVFKKSTDKSTPTQTMTAKATPVKPIANEDNKKTGGRTQNNVTVFKKSDDKSTPKQNMPAKVARIKPIANEENKTMAKEAVPPKRKYIRKVKLNTNPEIAKKIGNVTITRIVSPAKPIVNRPRIIANNPIDDNKIHYQDSSSNSLAKKQKK